MTRAGIGIGRLVDAQLRVAAGVLAAYDPPAFGRALVATLGRPHVEEVEIAGVPATLARPGRGQGPHPAFAIFPGVTRRGRLHPAFQGIARGLAATGHLAAVVEPPGLSAGMLTPELVDRARAAVLELADDPATLAGKVGLLGVSAGGTTALVCAAETDVAERVSAVAVVAPCCDIEQALRVVTTGAARRGSRLEPFAPGELFQLVMARSLVACLPPGADRDELVARLLALPEYGPEPLAVLRSRTGEPAEPTTRAGLALLANTDPARFDELYGTLAAEQRDALESLSPVLRADRIRSPVELIIAREDKYIPFADAEAFEERCPTTRLTVLESLTHAVPRLSPGGARDLARLDVVLVRFLASARAASYSAR